MKRYLIFIFILLLIISCQQSTKSIIKSFQSDQLKDTIISPYYKTKITKDKNIIFCSTFQLAWSALKDEIIKEDLILNNQPVLVNYLNNGLASKDDISEESYIAEAGFIKDGIVSKINNRWKEKFPDENIFFNIENNDPDSMISFSYLFKILEFKTVFELLDDPIHFNDNYELEIQGFGINDFNPSKSKHKKFENQVKVYDYINEDNFIIKLIPEQGKDEFILAKIPPKETVLKTIIEVYNRIENNNANPLTKNSTLQIPVFNFDIEHNYKELLYKNFKNKGFEDYFFILAKQNIKFILNEKGVKLKSFSIVLGIKSAYGNPLSLIFDKPFLLYLKEKNAKYPYFAMWINNEELMIKKE